jgi:hypothetical protein
MTAARNPGRFRLAGEPAPGLEPGTARLQDRFYPPHLAPTGDHSHAAVPTPDPRNPTG